MVPSHCLAKKEAIRTLKTKQVPLPSNVKAQSTVDLFEVKKEAYQRKRGKEKKKMEVRFLLLTMKNEEGISVLYRSGR